MNTETPMDDFRKHPIRMTFNVAMIVAGLGLISYGFFHQTPQESRNKAYERKLNEDISLIADQRLGNFDFSTTDDEWAKLYRELGRRYDVHSSNPFVDLTTEQKELILDKYKPIGEAK